jgi:Flp pilus assembly protein CpaB
MAQTHQRNRSRRMHPALLIGLVLLVGLVMAGVAAVMIGVRTGLIARGKVLAVEPDRTGKIPVPIAAQPIPAYTRVTRAHLFDLEKGDWAVAWLPEGRAEESGLITSAPDVLGRVLSHDKMKDYAFTEDDFLPQGTRAGPTGGIEPGMRGLRVPTDRVRGMHGLRLGDRFDLVAVQRIDDTLKPSRTTTVSSQLTANAALREAWGASTRVLAQNGKVVQPVVARAEPGSGRRQVEEVLIAVSEHEVAGLMEALAVEAEILCLPRSGQPGADSAMPEPAAPRPPNVIEVFSRSGRSTTVVPDAAPSQAMQGGEGGR